jgi:hypothetical protein
MFQEVLIIAATIVASIGLRSFAHPLVRKLGAVGMLVATYLTAYFLTRSHVVGAVAASLWFFLPLLEIFTRIRKLRMPLEKRLQHRPPPSSQDFPQLHDFTADIEKEGFEYVDDLGWEWDGVDQFFRVFYHPEERTQAAICLNRQQHVIFAYISLTSRTTDGRVYRTWNFPFSYTMKIAPEVSTNRAAHVDSFLRLLEEHRSYLQTLKVESADQVKIDLDADSAAEHGGALIEEQMEADTRRQIEHNLASGLIAKSDDDSTFRYSWRGLFFLWAQFVKDMVKLS